MSGASPAPRTFHGRAASLALLVVLLGPLLGACVLPAACGSFIKVPEMPPISPEVLDREFTREEIAADVDGLLGLIDEAHPDPYELLTHADVQLRRDALLAGLDDAITRCELQPPLAELIAALGDGHTTVYLPYEEFFRHMTGPQGCWPIDVHWENGALIVRRTVVTTEDGALAPGARILEIAGRPAPELFRTFLARQSGETEIWRAGSVENAFAVHLWLAGIRPPYRTRFAAATDGHEFEVDVPGFAYNVVVRGTVPSSGRQWQLERRIDGVAVLTLNSFSADLDQFEDWLEDVFEELHAQPPPALVIDLRSNGGGDSRLGDELLQYVTDHPWRQHGRKDWRVSEPLRRHMKSMLPAWIRWLPVQYLHPLGWQLWTTPAGELVTLDFDEETPRDEPLRYKGPVGWLIGPSTFSSASSLAVAVKDCHLGLLVGSETGGVVSGFGEVIYFRLPHTQLGAQISTAHFVRPSGEMAAHGVIPDLVVEPEAGEPGDPVLEAAVAALLSGHPATQPATADQVSAAQATGAAAEEAAAGAAP